MSKTQLKILVIEDNPIDTALIKKALTRSNDFISVGSIDHANSLAQGLAMLEEEPKDAILLDINLPDGRGIPLMEKVMDKAPLTPMIVLTGESDSKVAIAAFKAGAMNYIVKSELSGDLLNRSLRFALDRHKILKEAGLVSDVIKEKTKPTGSYFNSNLFIKTGNKYVSISFADILFIEATGDYVVIQSTSGKYITHCTMNQVEAKLNPGKFVRVHRSYIANFDKITNIQDNVLSIGGETIPIGRTYRQEFMDRINTL